MENDRCELDDVGENNQRWGGVQDCIVARVFKGTFREAENWHSWLLKYSGMVCYKAQGGEYSANKRSN